MKQLLKLALALCAAAAGAHASAQVTFYEHNNYEGRALTAQDPVPNFKRLNFNDVVSSVVVEGGPWEVCDDVDFHGRCLILRPGRYPSLGAMGMNDRLSSARPIPRGHRGERGDRDDRDRDGDDRYAPPPPPPPPPMPGQITFFEHDGFQGRAFSTEHNVDDFRQYGFNDRASSVLVTSERWEACEHADYGGRCVILRPGRYPSLAAMGLNDSLSSVRMLRPGDRVDDGRYAPPPPPVPVYDWRRRPEERLYVVNVSAVHAVYAAPQQRCWVEREQVQSVQPNAGGAILGGLIGGILGHQIGGGTGRDLATVGGAVAGAAIGANAGVDARGTSTQDVQRCASVPAQGRPDYWDLSYVFRGVEHHVQVTSPPGPTVTVNEAGEPRL